MMAKFDVLLGDEDTMVDLWSVYHLETNTADSGFKWFSLLWLQSLNREAIQLSGKYTKIYDQVNPISGTYFVTLRKLLTFFWSQVFYL